MPVSNKRKVLRSLVRGMYDIQNLRIMCGNRFVGNWKITRGQRPGEREENLDDGAKLLLAQVRAHNTKIATAMAEGRALKKDEDKLPSKVSDEVWRYTKKTYKAMTQETFPPREEFEGDGVISNYSELCLMRQYLELEKIEKFHEKMILGEIEKFPIYREFLEKVPGCGPRMGGCIIAWIDIHIATTVSKIHKYTGLDCGPDGRGRGRYKEHMVERAYIDKDGKPATKPSLTFEPFFKTKMVGVLADCFIKVKDSIYKRYYDNYKTRMEGHGKYGKHNDKKKDEKGQMITSKGRRNMMARRYMIKRFLADLYTVWRKLEGLPLRIEYAEAMQERKHEGWRSLEEMKIDPDKIKPQPYEATLRDEDEVYGQAAD